MANSTRSECAVPHFDAALKSFSPKALVSAFEMEDAIVAGENEMALKTAKLTCAGWTKNVEYTKGHVRLDKVYVDSVAKYTAIVVYNYTCNIFKR